MTKDTFLAGRQIEIEVDLLAPNYFMSAARFPQVSVPGAVVTLGDDAQNFTETIDGTDFSGIRRIYRITPLAPGHYQLPPAPVTFSYAAQPGVATPGRATLPAVSFDVAPLRPRRTAESRWCRPGWRSPRASTAIRPSSAPATSWCAASRRRPRACRRC